LIVGFSARSGHRHAPLPALWPRSAASAVDMRISASSSTRG
jgi:hypothetical protein